MKIDKNMKKRTPLQEWSSRRNWGKYEVIGIRFKVESLLRRGLNILTQEERGNLATAHMWITRMLHEWDNLTLNAKGEFLSREVTENDDTPTKDNS